MLQCDRHLPVFARICRYAESGGTDPRTSLGGIRAHIAPFRSLAAQGRKDREVATSMDRNWGFHCLGYHSGRTVYRSDLGDLVPVRVWGDDCVRVEESKLVIR